MSVINWAAITRDGLLYGPFKEIKEAEEFVRERNQEYPWEECVIQRMTHPVLLPLLQTRRG